MSTPLAVFGPGILIATRTDTTPGVAINVGYVQEFSIEVAGTTKSLYGQNQFPLVAARATIKASGKFKSAVVSGIAMNAMFYGMTMSTSSNLISWTIASTQTLSTASTTAVQMGSSLTFDADLGVTYSTSGLPLQRVSTGSEAAGKYSVNSTSTGAGPGIYNFAAADTTSGTAGGTAIKVTYSSNGTSGQSLPVSNQLIGTTPTFQLDYYTNLNQPTAKPFVVRIYQSIMDKEMLSFKLEDFLIPEWDFTIFADNSGRVFNYVLPEIS